MSNRLYKDLPGAAMGQECPHHNRKCYSFEAATDAIESELLEDPLRRELHDSWIRSMLALHSLKW